MIVDAPVLETKRVCKCFGGVTALEDMTLAIKPSSSVGVIGPNGCGKTTLFNVLSGFVVPDRGEILLDGRAFEGAGPSDFACAGIGRTFQEGRLWSNLTVSENVIVALRGGRGSWFTSRLPSMREREDVEELLDLVDLDLGLLQADTRALTLNQRRRVELARALALHPSVLLVDEVAAGLNPVESTDLLKLVIDVGRQRAMAVVVVEHKLDILFAICDRILIMDEGRIHADGSPAAIRSRPGELSPYLGNLGVGGAESRTREGRSR